MNADRPSPLEVDPFGPEVQQCPYPFLAAVHAACGVHRDPHSNVVIVARHSDVREVLRRTDTFSSHGSNEGTEPSASVRAKLQQIASTGYPRAEALIRLDPPEHGAHRRLVNQVFSPRAVERLRPFVRSVARALASDVAEQLRSSGRCDVVESFAIPLPLRVITHVLGFAPERETDVKRWSDHAVLALGNVPTDEQRVETARSLVDYQHFVASEIERRRTAPDPDDLLRPILDSQLTLPEMLSLIHQLMVAGNETTTNLLAEGMLVLARDPHLWRQLQDDRSLLPLFLEELLRYASPTQGFTRHVRVPTSLGPYAMAPGDRVRAMFAGANRDPSVFPDPDSFDLHRTNANEHLAFGFGAHFCVGAALARAEAIEGFEALLDLLEVPRVAEDRRVEYRPSATLRGLTSLQLVQ